MSLRRRRPNRNRPEMISWIIENGGDVHHVDDYGKQAIHDAVLYDSLDAIDSLLSHGANINAKDKNGDTPCIHASRGLVKFFLNSRELSLRRRKSNRARPEMLEKIIENGGDFRELNKWKRQAIHMAAFYGNVDALNILLKKGVDINAKDLNGNTPIIDQGSDTPQRTKGCGCVRCKGVRCTHPVCGFFGCFSQWLKSSKIRNVIYKMSIFGNFLSKFR